MSKLFAIFIILIVLYMPIVNAFTNPFSNEEGTGAFDKIGDGFTAVQDFLKFLMVIFYNFIFILLSILFYIMVFSTIVAPFIAIKWLKSKGYNISDFTPDAMFNNFVSIFFRKGGNKE